MNNGYNFQTAQKQNLQLSLKLWLPILQAPLGELETVLNEHSFDNPFLECSSSFESTSSNNSSSGDDFDKRGFIENSSLYKPSLYDILLEQIAAPLFPTPNSQKIASEIVFNINSEGYFDGDIEQIATKCNTTLEFAENIRKRFSYLEPSGVGASNLEESFLFQLYDLELESGISEFVKKIIMNLKNIDKYHAHHHFQEAKSIIKKFKNPPVTEYQEDSVTIIPDFFVEVGDKIEIKINSEYYPDVIVDDPFKSKKEGLKEKLKEARNLVNLLDLRKSTLYKLVLIIVEKQIGFFLGSELKPLTMAEVASEIGFEESTISRAVSNKYIKCSKGTLSLKSFFTNALTKDLSSSEIKSFIQQLIDNEDRDKPLTDQDLVDIVMKRYSLSMVRRTITKYRKLLNIPSSKERKKFYKI
ncbi:MAG: RNA polymerase factor sigma-54 [Campylobacterota bacterium]|nr:RNA polymerase factor sigma-54 [Campylobacterota bacterium]